MPENDNGRADGEILTLESVGNLVSMVASWDEYEPRKRVSRAYEFRCDSVRWERKGVGSVERYSKTDGHRRNPAQAKVFTLKPFT